jgi:cholesterol transport system auxiliary component
MIASMVKIDMKNVPRPVSGWVLCCLTMTLLLSGCASMSAPQTISQSIYVLEAQPATNLTQVKRNLVLAVSTPRTRSGFDTVQIAYTKKPHELNYYLASRWAATPARMLEPLLLETLRQSGSFRSVVQIAGAVPADVILETELIRLQQNFEMSPSRAQLTLQAQLIDVRGKRVLAVKQFDVSENASSEDAYGGVTAVNRLLSRVLGQLAEFCISESVLQ